MANNLPALSTRPFIAPRMSAGMKVAICFLVLTGIVVVGGMVMTLSQIMERLDSADQDNVAQTLPTQTTTLASTAQSESHAYPVIGQNVDKWVLPEGAVVQQLVPHLNNVYLLVEMPGQGQRIIIIDSKTGTMRRDIRLENSAH